MSRPRQFALLNGIFIDVDGSIDAKHFWLKYVAIESKAMAGMLRIFGFG
jgi:hypothetical protein